ncbi:cold shock-induced protein TIR1-like [Melanotaenia boesemani]|uniref:cold shock-induced protein TIR1-like n=1 Tax=Melanotaenia boesemani TaxID=1250792 RepID=UPI001C05E348|nr:cold shock-induced protein TIR1-like [Melanotaenia boesemani]
MFGLRTKKQITTKFSPFFLLFGTEARYPSEVPEDYEIDSSVEKTVKQEVVSEAIDRQESLFNVVRQNIKKAQDAYKTPKSEKKASFNVGEEVLRKNIRSQQRKGGKLDPNWTGPFTIVAIHDKSADLQSETQFIPKVNIDHLQPFKAQQPRIPHQIKSQRVQLATTPPPASPKAPGTVIASVPASSSTSFSTLAPTSSPATPADLTTPSVSATPTAFAPPSSTTPSSISAQPPALETPTSSASPATTQASSSGTVEKCDISITEQDTPPGSTWRNCCQVKKVPGCIKDVSDLRWQIATTLLRDSGKLCNTCNTVIENKYDCTSCHC